MIVAPRGKSFPKRGRGQEYEISEEEDMSKDRRWGEGETRLSEEERTDLSLEASAVFKCAETGQKAGLCGGHTEHGERSGYV